MKFSEYLERFYPEVKNIKVLFERIKGDILENYEFYCREILKTKPEYDVV